MALEWWTRGKPSVLGMISGAVAGLGTITPASGFVLPWHGVVIGMIAGAGLLLELHLAEAARAAMTTRSTCSASTASAAPPARCWSACSPRARSATSAGCSKATRSQVLIQLYGIVVTLAWSGIVTFVLLKVIGCSCRCGCDRQSEIEGLDVTQHGEALQ